MKKIKIISVSILIFTFIIFFSTIAYAKPLTDAFRSSLIQVNDFFEKEQYKAYATTIDFFFFSLLFIAIYMMGARYAFKEIKRPEQVIVILLGLMTGFLLVIGGFSATILLPYINWLLYILLFILLYRLLKGIKSKFWRFVLALLLTLLIIGIFAWLFNVISPPEISAPPLGGIGEFFKSFADSFKGIDFGRYQPGVPSYLRDLFELPSAPTPTPTGPETLPTTTPPTTPTKPEGKGGIFGTGYSWLWPIIILLLAGSGVFAYRRSRREEAPTQLTPTPSEVLTIQDIIDGIGKKIKNKTDSKTNMEKINQVKNRLLQQGDAKTGYIGHLIRIVNEKGEEEIANLFLDESRTLEEFEEGNIKEIIKKEREFVQELKNLKGIEWDLYYSFLFTGRWEAVILQNIADDKKSSVKSLLYMLKLLIDQNINQRAKDSEKGILWLIVFCYNLEKKENILAKELLVLFDKSHIEELVKGKFKESIKDELTLEAYNQKENELIALLLRRISKQIEVLEYLKRLIEQAPPQPGQATPEVLRGLRVSIRSPVHEAHYTKGTPIPLEAQVFTHENTPFTVGPNMILTWDLSQTIRDATGATREISMRLHTGLTGNPTAPTKFVSGHRVNLTATLRDAATKNYISASGMQIYLDEPGQAPEQPTVQTPINFDELFYNLYNLLKSESYAEAERLLEENQKILDAKQFELLKEFVDDTKKSGLTAAYVSYYEKRRMEI